MSRVTTTNYGAQATTQFAWATTDADQFDRELDLYHLSQAVELHDHSSGRGLPVARLAANAVDAASIGALSVTTEKINNLAVTNGKLAAGAVTHDKITWPLVQSANSMAGGFRMRETSNTYAVGFYMAANGLATFGAGTVATIGTNLILGQAGQVSVGTSQGAALFNVLQSATVIGSGIRIYNPNTLSYLDFYSQINGYGVLAHNGADSIWYANGCMSVAGANFTARLNIAQQGGTLNDGFYTVLGAGTGRAYVDASGHFNLQSATSAILLGHGVAVLSPAVTGAVALGSTSLRWGAAFVTSLNSSGAITGPGSMPLNAVIWFPTTADLTAAGAPWAAYAAGAGRLLIGAGTTFGQAFAEATNYGANWTPGASITYTPSGTTGNVVNGGGYLANITGGTTTAFQDHQHPIVPTNAIWLPPMRAGVWGQRTS